MCRLRPVTSSRSTSVTAERQLLAAALRTARVRGPRAVHGCMLIALISNAKNAKIIKKNTLYSYVHSYCRNSSRHRACEVRAPASYTVLYRSLSIDRRAATRDVARSMIYGLSNPRHDGAGRRLATPRGALRNAASSSKRTKPVSIEIFRPTPAPPSPDQP